MPQLRLKKQNRPLRVGYDIVRMSAGGANGGIKAHHYEFMRHFAEHYGRKLSLVVFCREEIVPELSFLSAGPFNQIHVIGDKSERDYRDSDGPLPPLQFWPSIPEQFLEKLGVDLLYCGFGYSDLWTPKVPQISLIVDALHKDLPEALPPAEVAHRERWYQEAIARSALIQTNSKFCVASLKRHYGIPEEKLFHIYLPLHGRFNRVEMGALPDCLVGKKYFFYPANHWPHKNHECLFLGYRKYRRENPRSQMMLACTGHSYERTDYLKELSETLGLSKSICFLGHLKPESLKAVWELATALVFPSLYEGFGLPVLEALHFQKPLACSDIATTREIAGDLANYFNPRMPAEIASALMTLNLSIDLDRNRLAHEAHRLDSEAQRLLMAFRTAMKPEPTCYESRR